MSLDVLGPGPAALILPHRWNQIGVFVARREVLVCSREEYVNRSPRDRPEQAVCPIL